MSRCPVRCGLESGIVRSARYCARIAGFSLADSMSPTPAVPSPTRASSASRTPASTKRPTSARPALPGNTSAEDQVLAVINRARAAQAVAAMTRTSGLNRSPPAKPSRRPSWPPGLGGGRTQGELCVPGMRHGRRSRLVGTVMA
jgi:hypothetical protein